MDDIQIIIKSSGKVRYLCRHNPKKRLCADCQKRIGEQIKRMIELEPVIEEGGRSNGT